MKTGVYLILHEADQTFYVGSAAVSFEIRWSKHKHLLRLGKHPNAHLQAAWTKHGEDSFDFLVAERCLPEDCLAVEQKWLDSLSAEGTRLYNKCMTAGSTFGITLSDEAKRKMSSARKGRKHSEETKLRIRESRLAYFQTEQGRCTREAVRRANKGKHLSEETKELLSRVRTENPMTHVGNLYRGKHLSADHRRKVSEGLKRFYSSEAGEEYRQTISVRQRGRKASEEAEQKQKDALTGRTVSKEARRKISEARKNHEVNLDEESRRKRSEVLSKAQSGRKHSEESNQKRREKLLGHTVSEETRKKISEARGKSYQRSRATIIVEG